MTSRLFTEDMLDAATTTWQQLAQSCLDRPAVEVTTDVRPLGVSIVIWRNDPSFSQVGEKVYIDSCHESDRPRRERALRIARALEVALLDPLHLNLMALGAWEP